MAEETSTSSTEDLTPLKSRIIKKLSIDFDHEIKVDRVLIDREIVTIHQKRLTEYYKNDKLGLSEQEKMRKMDDALRDVILKDNFFNKIMEFIVPYFEFEFSDEDIEKQTKILKSNFPNRKEEDLRIIAEKSIQKQLIFTELEKQFNLKLSDEAIKKNLETSAKNIDEDFQALIGDKNRYDALASLMQEEYVISFLLSKFPLRVDLPYDWQTHQIMLVRLPKNPNAVTNEEVNNPKK